MKTVKFTQSEFHTILAALSIHERRLTQDGDPSELRCIRRCLDKTIRAIEASTA